MDLDDNGWFKYNHKWFSCWPLAIGCWPLVTGIWILVSGDGLLVTGFLSDGKFQVPEDRGRMSDARSQK